MLEAREMLTIYFRSRNSTIKIGKKADNLILKAEYLTMQDTKAIEIICSLCHVPYQFSTEQSVIYIHQSI